MGYMSIIIAAAGMVRGDPHDSSKVLSENSMGSITAKGWWNVEAELLMIKWKVLNACASAWAG
jgi:hypothetical protein